MLRAGQTARQLWPAWPPPPVVRIGLDQGGVLQWHGGTDLLPGAVAAVQSLVNLVGCPSRIYIISRVNRANSTGALRSLSATGFFVQTGVPEENHHTVTETVGPRSKGPLAIKFGLSVFVDDRADNLATINYALAGRTRLLIHFTGDPVSQRRSGPTTTCADFRSAATWETVVALCRDEWPRLSRGELRYQ